MSRCPQCTSKDCPDLVCRFTGKEHKNADQRGDTRPWGDKLEGAPASPDYEALGVECAWPNGALT